MIRVGRETGNTHIFFWPYDVQWYGMLNVPLKFWLVLRSVTGVVFLMTLVFSQHKDHTEWKSLTPVLRAKIINHLSHRLIGEPIVHAGIWSSSTVRRQHFQTTAYQDNMLV